MVFQKKNDFVNFSKWFFKRKKTLQTFRNGFSKEKRLCKLFETVFQKKNDFVNFSKQFPLSWDYLGLIFLASLAKTA